MSDQKTGSSSKERKGTSGTQPSGPESQQFDAKTQAAVDMLLASLRTGKAQLKYDDKGNVIVDYPKDQRTVIYDATGANMLAIPKTDEDMRNKVEASLELVNYIKTEKPPSGVVVDISKISPSGKLYREGMEFEMTKKVLGSGNIAKDIVIVKDKVKGEEHALKTMMISMFNRNEIRCWVDMSHTGLVPALYLFYIKDNKIYMHMEILKEAKTLREIIDVRMGKFYEKEDDRKLVKPFSLFVLDGALEAVTAMHGKNWVHKDIHGGNVMVQKQPGVELMIKIIDFGSVGQLRSEQGGIDFQGFQMDIIGILRLFTGLYTFQEFNDAFHMKKDWTPELKEMTDALKFSQADKDELFCLVDAALKIVSPADVPQVRSMVKERLGNAMGDEDSQMKILKKVCMILFPEEFEKEAEQLEDTTAASKSGPTTGLQKDVHSSRGWPMSASVDFSELSDFKKTAPPSLDSATRQLRPVKSMDDMHLQAFIDLKRLEISIRK